MSERALSALLALPALCLACGTPAPALPSAPRLPGLPGTPLVQQEPSRALPSLPARVPPTRGSLPLRAWRNHVRVYSTLALDFEYLANVAQWTRDRSFRWLSEQDFETEPIEIFLCDSEDELRRLEAELPLPGARALTRTAKGGYFHSQSAILLLVEEGRSTEWLLSHEMFHSVFRTLARANPPALNEGLAEVVPSWILFGQGPTPEDAGATYPGYEAVLDELVAGGHVPSLESFLRLTRDEFHENRWASFALAWSLARLLVESDEAAIRGRLPLLLSRLHDDPWEAFTQVYDAALVEAHWHAVLGHRAPGTPGAPGARALR